jgi:hypothetical protein
MSKEAIETAIQERVALIAAAESVPLAADSGARIARAVAPTLSRLAGVTLAFEIEPSSYVVVACGEIRE